MNKSIKVIVLVLGCASGSTFASNTQSIVNGLTLTPQVQVVFNSTPQQFLTPAQQQANANSKVLAQQLIDTVKNARYGDNVSYTAVQSLIMQDANSSYQDPTTGMTALMVAAQKLDLTLVQLLIYSASLVTTKNPKDKNKTALDYALQKTPLAQQRASDRQGIINLLKAEIKVDLLTQFIFKISASDIDGAIALLKNNSAIATMTDPLTGTTALKDSASLLNEELLDALVKAGAKLDIQDNYGWTALMDVASIGNIDLVNALIAAGADITVLNKNNESVYDVAYNAYQQAEQKKQSTVNFVQILNALNKKAMVLYNTAFNTFLTALNNNNLQQALTSGNTLQKLLNAHLVYQYKETDSVFAQITQQIQSLPSFADNFAPALQTLCMLINPVDMRAYINTVYPANNSMQSPSSTLLTHLAVVGNVKMMQVLINAGAHVNFQDSNGNTALTFLMNSIASLSAIEAGVAMLIKAGANVNLSTNANNGNATPLMIAVQNNYLSIVQLLLANGAQQTINQVCTTPANSSIGNPLETVVQPSTALDIANNSSTFNQAIVTALTNAGAQPARGN